MNHTELNTFLLVAHTGSFSKAAHQLYISKNAVMQQINNLETHLDVTLFNRSTHGVTLTNAGRALVDKGTKLNQMFQEINMSLDQYKNTIFVGSGFLNAPFLIKRLWPQFAAQTKNSTITFTELTDYENISKETDIIEGVFSNRPFLRQGFTFQSYGSIPLVALVSPEDPLSQLSKVTYSDLENKVIWILDDNTLDSSSVIKEKLLDNVAKIKIREYSVLNTAVINNAEIHHDILIIPKSMTGNINDCSIKPIDWTLTQRYGFYYRNYSSELSQKFLDFIMNSTKQEI